jgi:hypothetical protein
MKVTTSERTWAGRPVVVELSDLEPAVDRPLGDVCKPFRQPSECGLA